METKDFINAVNDEFDIETLELMKGLIDKRLILLKSMQDVAVKKQIKVESNNEFSLSFSQVSMPSIPGIITSKTIKSGTLAFAFSIPSSPLDAVIVL